MRKNTPGPWEHWIKGGDYSITGISASLAYAAMEGIQTLANKDAHLAIQIAAENQSAPAIVFGNTREEAEANARLIAATHVILDALKSAHHMLTRDYIDPAKMAVVNKCSEAIELATGEDHG